jgi:transcriptional regulator with XRE-family HTH domain
MRKNIETSPKQLANKLTFIRKYLGLSQNELLQKLGFQDRLFRSNISQYERGHRDPPLLVLLQYARLVDLSIDVLVDDKLNISEYLSK